MPRQSSGRSEGDGAAARRVMETRLERVTELVSGYPRKRRNCIPAGPFSDFFCRNAVSAGRLSGWRTCPRRPAPVRRSSRRGRPSTGFPSRSTGCPAGTPRFRDTRRTSSLTPLPSGTFFAHCLASSFEDTSRIQKPLNSSLASVYGPSVTTGGSASKSTTKPSSGPVRPSPASITPALMSSSLKRPIDSMISLKSMFILHGGLSLGGGTHDQHVARHCVSPSRCGRGASIVPSLTRRTATPRNRHGPEKSLKKNSGEAKVQVRGRAGRRFAQAVCVPPGSGRRRGCRASRRFR